VASRVHHLTAFEDDVIDPDRSEAATHRKTGRSATYNDHRYMHLR